MLLLTYRDLAIIQLLEVSLSLFSVKSLDGMPIECFHPLLLYANSYSFLLY